MEELRNKLYRKIKILSETVWDRRANRSEIDMWLENFTSNDPILREKEKLHALYLLSQFMYFASNEMRVLLVSMYRDLIRYPIIETIRKDNSNTVNLNLINCEFKKDLEKTRFLGVGNPSESGTHLLYYFRQENNLAKDLFINSHEIFSRNSDKEVVLDLPDVKRYVFIDDFAGSGDQAIKYSSRVVKQIKEIDAKIEVLYFVLFANKKALKAINEEAQFNKCDSVFKLDNSYMCFSKNSRYRSSNNQIDMDFAHKMAASYGQKLFTPPLGFDNNQLLLGFFHNTPDNTLPIMWSGGNAINKWAPIFKRYPKKYGDIP